MWCIDDFGESMTSVVMATLPYLIPYLSRHSKQFKQWGPPLLSSSGERTGIKGTVSDTLKLLIVTGRKGQGWNPSER